MAIHSKKNKNHRLISLLFLVSLIVLLSLIFIRPAHKSQNATYRFQGETMGTFYSIIISGKLNIGPETLKKRIQTRLNAIDHALSTWQPDSEVSRFNKLQSTDWFSISDDFFKVLQVAETIHQESKGGFDITLFPLVDLWGYGPDKQEEIIKKTTIQRLLKNVDQATLMIEPSRIQKKNPEVTIDLSAIAKGYAVDEVAKLLRKHEISNFTVEIGGEVVVSGRNPQEEPWSVGIEAPVESHLKNKSYIHRLELTSGALATSGSYHNYQEQEQNKIKSHHIIDPKTGYPTDNGVVSVTVYAPTCMEADAIATALMVLGVEQGLTWIEEKPHVEALFLRRTQEGYLSEQASSGFKTLFGETGRIQ